MPSSGLFAPLFVPDALGEALSDQAWLQAMLDVEAALARAQARVGLVPAAAADVIARCCRAERFDVDALGRDARDAGNPVVPLVRALRAAVGTGDAPHVHRGATSQDVLDTAAMLVARRALDLLLADLDGVAGGCAHLAAEHRATLMPGRTLLQQALPTTFGLKAAGWLVGVVEARRGLGAVRDARLAVQLGGAAGTLSALGPEGLAVVAALADELALAEPVLPWHTARGRVAELAAALAVAAGALGKLALDVVLLAQTEVAEVAEVAGGGRGGSSTLPHKRNPVGAVLARACAARATAAAGLLIGAMAQEHERAAGAWHAEWEALREALGSTGGAAAAAREVVGGLEVSPSRMRANLDLAHGLLMAEPVAAAVGHRPGGEEAVRAAALRAGRTGRHLRDELLEEAAVREALSREALDALLDPAGYLGASDGLIDRALALHAAAGDR